MQLGRETLVYEKLFNDRAGFDTGRRPPAGVLQDRGASAAQRRVPGDRRGSRLGLRLRSRDGQGDGHRLARSDTVRDYVCPCRELRWGYTLVEAARGCCGAAMPSSRARGAARDERRHRTLRVAVRLPHAAGRGSHAPATSSSPARRSLTSSPCSTCPISRASSSSTVIHAEESAELHEGERLAIFPPVAGG